MVLGRAGEAETRRRNLAAIPQQLGPRARAVRASADRVDARAARRGPAGTRAAAPTVAPSSGIVAPGVAEPAPPRHGERALVVGPRPEPQASAGPAWRSTTSASSTTARRHHAPPAGVGREPVADLVGEPVDARRVGRGTDPVDPGRAEQRSRSGVDDRDRQVRAGVPPLVARSRNHVPVSAVYGDGTDVQRGISGSWHAATSASRSSRRHRRSATTPSVRPASGNGSGTGHPPTSPATARSRTPTKRSTTSSAQRGSSGANAARSCSLIGAAVGAARIGVRVEPRVGAQRVGDLDDVDGPPLDRDARDPDAGQPPLDARRGRRPARRPTPSRPRRAPCSRRSTRRGAPCPPRPGGSRSARRGRTVPSPVCRSMTATRRASPRCALHDRRERALRPHRRRAAEEDPARVPVLAGAHRGLETVEAVLARVLEQRARGRGLRGLVPHRRARARRRAGRSPGSRGAPPSKSMQLRLRSTLSSLTRRIHAKPYGLIAWTSTTARSGGRSTPSRSHAVWHRLPAKPSTPCVPEITSSRSGASGGPSTATSVASAPSSGPGVGMGVVRERRAGGVGGVEERGRARPGSRPRASRGDGVAGRGDGVPDAAEAVAVDVTRRRVTREAVEQVAVVPDPLRPVRLRAGADEALVEAGRRRSARSSPPPAATRRGSPAGTVLTSAVPSGL